jgi:hypothetical protein|tara:strand:- start:4118 stop:4492 length:375 start_codon:yes stop_codon:yes gene_type:complete
MAYSTTIKLVTGDTYPELTFNLKDSNTAASGATLDEEDSSTWQAVNLTGDSVRLRVRELGSTTITSTLNALLTNASAGTCAVLFTTSTFPTAGTYEGEIEHTDASGKIQTVQDLIKFVVRSDFD